MLDENNDYRNNNQQNFNDYADRRVNSNYNSYGNNQRNYNDYSDRQVNNNYNDYGNNQQNYNGYSNRRVNNNNYNDYGNNQQNYNNYNSNNTYPPNNRPFQFVNNLEASDWYKARLTKRKKVSRLPKNLSTFISFVLTVLVMFAFVSLKKISINSNDMMESGMYETTGTIDFTKYFILAFLGCFCFVVIKNVIKDIIIYFISKKNCTVNIDAEIVHFIAQGSMKNRRHYPVYRFVYNNQEHFVKSREPYFSAFKLMHGLPVPEKIKINPDDVAEIFIEGNFKVNLFFTIISMIVCLFMVFIFVFTI